MTKPTVFIDGEAGTTGLEIRKRLEGRTDIELLSIVEDKRKDVSARKKLLNSVDLAMLCLPDDAAREAVGLIDNPKVKIIDASTAHRTAEDWIYGFPELTPHQEDAIRQATRVSNPGCYPTGALALIRPLTDAGIMPLSSGLTITAISGYSGGGKELIALCKNPDGNIRGGPFSAYGLDQKHKHIPEIRTHGRLEIDPIFLPSYSGAFYRGMLIEMALRMKDLNRQSGKSAGGEEIHAALAKHFSGKRNLKVEPLRMKLEPGYVISPLSQNETNNLQLNVFWNAEKEIVILTAVLDNLGKGASGAAVQSMNIMLGTEG